MAREVSHSKIVAFHRDIARYHKGINSFYRFNISEVANNFRNGIATPALMLESHSSELQTNPNGTTTFNGRSISFLVLDSTLKPDNYEKQEEVLDATENICLDIAAYLKQQHQTQSSWLYGLLDVNSIKVEKVGPVWGTMFGWNVLYTVKNKESMIVNPEVWDFNAPEI